MTDGVMISYLPTNTEWCRQEFPHMTLVYCGTTEDLNPGTLNEIAKDAISAARLTRAFGLNVIGVEVFGEDFEKVDVLRLYPSPELMLARRVVEKWNASEHDFNAHATIGPEGSAFGELPTFLYFDRIAVSWGSKSMIFQLGN